MGDSPRCGEMSAKQTEGTARPRGAVGDWGIVLDILYATLQPLRLASQATSPYTGEAIFYLPEGKQVGFLYANVKSAFALLLS